MTHNINEFMGIQDKGLLALKEGDKILFRLEVPVSKWDTEYNKEDYEKIGTIIEIKEMPDRHYPIKDKIFDRNTQKLDRSFTVKEDNGTIHDIEGNQIIEKLNIGSNPFSNEEAFSISPENSSILNAYRQMYEKKTDKPCDKKTKLSYKDKDEKGHKRAYGKNVSQTPDDEE